MTLDDILLLVVGASIGWAVQQYYVSRSEDVAMFNDHIRDIEKFSDAAQIYWLSSPADVDSDRLLSARVRAGHATTTLLYQPVRELLAARRPRYEKRFLLLYRLATSGDFESVNRTMDASRAAEIADAAARLVHVVRAGRSDLVSLPRFFRSAVKWMVRVGTYQPGNSAATLEHQADYLDRQDFEDHLR